MKFQNSNRGFIKAIVIIVIALIILAYFGLNLRNIVDSETFQDNWDFVKESVVWLWVNILKTPVLFIWNIAIKPLLVSLGDR